MNTVNYFANWPTEFTVLFVFVGLALVFHGFPDLHIGKKEIHYHENDDK